MLMSWSGGGVGVVFRRWCQDGLHRGRMGSTEMTDTHSELGVNGFMVSVVDCKLSDLSV